MSCYEAVVKVKFLRALKGTAERYRLRVTCRSDNGVLAATSEWSIGAAKYYLDAKVKVRRRGAS